MNPDDRALFHNVQAEALLLRDSIVELFDFEPGDEPDPDAAEVAALVGEARRFVERLERLRERLAR